MNILLSLMLGIVVYSLYIYLKYLIPLRKKEAGFKYVYIEFDGSVRELTDEEKDSLNQTSYASDRLYIKNRYYKKTADGNLQGIILRRRVPKSIKIFK